MTNRTEAPTPRRLREARRRGEIATSPDLVGAGALLGALVGTLATATTTARVLAEALRSGIARAILASVGPGAASLEAVWVLARVAWAPLGGAAAGALLVGAFQSQWLFSLEAVRFRWERIQPFRTGATLLSGAHLGRLGMGLLKALVLAAVGWNVATSRLRSLPDLTHLEAGRLLAVLAQLALFVLGPIAGAAFAAGSLDWALAIRRHRRRLMMTRDEVQREQREEQGDPRHKAERRRLHRALASAAPLREAACVVVNPTHVAVALHHDRARDEAPVVVAKGEGRAAARLRLQARRTGLPIVEDISLARALYRLAEIGDEIPEELYEAAAVVLAELYRGQGRAP